MDCLPFAPKLTADGSALPQMLTHPFTLIYMYHKGKKFSQELVEGKISEDSKKLGS